MSILNNHPLVKYKQCLIDLKLIWVTDSLLAAGMITYSLASTRELWCLWCAIPETWYFSLLSEDHIVRSAQCSSKQQNNYPGLRASKLETDPCRKSGLNCQNKGCGSLLNGCPKLRVLSSWKATPEFALEQPGLFVYEQLSWPCLRPILGDLDASIGFFLSEKLNHK